MSGAVPKREPVVCIVTSKGLVYSETFIQAHIEHLPARVEPVYVSGSTWLTHDGVPLLNMFGRIAKAVAGEVGVDASALQLWVLGRHLMRRRVQAVLAEFGTIGARVYRACERTGIPLIVHFHGYDAYQRSRIEGHRRGYQEMFGMAAAIVAVSHDMEEQLMALGAPRDKIVYCPCGVDVEGFSGAKPGAAPPTFLAVGRFVDKKAPHLTLLAFHKVVQALPEARLIMVGEGDLLHACRQIATTLQLDGKVSFLGAIAHAQVASLMRGVRCFVQHSMRAADGDSEGTPVAVLEASAAGLPVVATAHAGIRDVVVHGETGFLVPEGDVDRMAHFMTVLANDAALADRLGQEARTYITAHFTRQASIARLWSVIERAIAQAIPNPNGAREPADEYARSPAIR